MTANDLACYIAIAVLAIVGGYGLWVARKAEAEVAKKPGSVKDE